MSFPQFKDLGDDVWLYEPQDSCEGNENISPVRRTRNVGSEPPALIILCTWLGGATPKRIEKYTQGYHRLWPSSRILLIRTTLSEYLVQSTTSLHRKLRPAQREIRRLVLKVQRQDELPSRPEDGEIILHVFSQGGSNIATQLLESTNAILATLGRRGPLPLRQIVFDSCPGDPGVYSSFLAAARSLPDMSILRPFGGVAVFVLAAGLVGMEATGLKAPLAKTMRSQLNDPEIFSPRAARLYLTSKADKIVDSRDVEEHRNQAAAKGFTTDILQFQKAAHCSLVLENDAVYWDAISSGWERSGASSSGNGTGYGGDATAPQPPSVSINTFSQARSRL